MRPFSYSWIIRTKLNNITTVLDIGCGEGATMSDINYDRQLNVTGIDLYEPSVIVAQKRGSYNKVLVGDIRALPFGSKSFDAVVSSQVVEHLEKEEAQQLISQMETIGSKVIIVATTNGFFPFEPLEGEDDNPLQVHKSGWSVKEFQDRGYKVYGQGLGLIYKPEGLAHKSKHKLIRNILFLVSYLFSPVVYYFPQLSAYLIAVKKYE
ncbi:MAG: hypothetical protein KatS3mg087_0969 [Patescibacteria group bacterium]|nr:MAG: hypothetical protein KatS3mg087_0969 [Patescibacteria group bacterium]